MSGQLMLVLAEARVAPAAVWELLPVEARAKVTVMLARLIAAMVEAARDERGLKDRRPSPAAPRGRVCAPVDTGAGRASPRVSRTAVWAGGAYGRAGLAGRVGARGRRGTGMSGRRVEPDRRRVLRRETWVPVSARFSRLEPERSRCSSRVRSQVAFFSQCSSSRTGA
jgi:hypothetical protein